MVALLALVFIGLGIGPAFSADVTTPFAGKAVNGGTVTHDHRDGKHVLAVSPDFQIPGSPDPHCEALRRRSAKSWC